MVRRIALTMAAAAALAVGILALNTGAAAPTSPYTWFAPLVDVERAIADRYVEEPDFEAMQIGAINGMIESLNDPHTEFIPKSLISDFDKNVRGRYVGIGAAVIIEDGEVTIVTPLDDSPAFHAGIMAGDMVIAVDGKPTTGLPLQATIDMLSGEPKTKVTVTIRRGAETFDVPIVRQQIVTRTVSGWKRDGEQWDFMIDPAHGIGYLRLSQFTTSSPEEMRRAIDQMQKEGLRGLILDLRFNQGGLFIAATQIADFFLDSGLIVKSKGRAHPEQPIYATKQGTYPEFPIAVIVNRQSASASEVLAGALKDNERAVVVGTRSYGKGVMQNVLALPSGAGQLKITEQYYYGPSGRKIQRTDDSTEWGVDPSDGYFVTMSDDEYMEMLAIQRENAIIRNGARAGVTAGEGPQWIIDELKDMQLAAAVEGMIGRLETGKWPRVSDEDAQGGVERVELRRMQEAHERLLRDLERVQRRIKALASVAPEDQLADPESIVPEGTDLTGGTIELKNAGGDVVAKLRITGPGVERWLIDAPVVKESLGDRESGPSE